jgi:hypothetical protein
MSRDRDRVIVVGHSHNVMSNAGTQRDQQRSWRRKQEQAAKKANNAPQKDSPATNGAQEKLSTSFNSDDMGMKAERQRIIQASLSKC